eukprot:GFUD01024685.1.p1 GENE.GFUD01024685.1~~GFUD01024685.1.p1  ORF type:complete len:1211 (+),score=419.30 GFUD01024685.1:52-3633(+)
MGDREDKLSKAREKLDKFRKKKQMLQDPTKVTEDVQSSPSSASSPVMFQEVNTPSSVPPPVTQPPDQGTVSGVTPISPPAPCLSSYFGQSDAVVGETEFEVILQPSTDITTKGDHEDQGAANFDVPAPTIGDDLLANLPESSLENNGLPAVSSMEELPNIAEEALTAALPPRLLPEDADQTFSDLPVAPSVEEISNLVDEVEEALTPPLPTQLLPDETFQTFSVSPPVSSMEEVPNIVEEAPNIVEEAPNIVEEAPNIIEEAFTPVLPTQHFPVENFQTLNQPSTSPAEVEFESLDQSAEVEFQSLDQSSLPTFSTPATPAEAESQPALVDQSEVAVTSSEIEVESSTTESLKQLSSHLSGLLADQSNFSSSSSVVSLNNYSGKVVELEERNQELVKLLDEERKEKENAKDELDIVKTQINELQSRAMEERITVESKLEEENVKLKADLAAQAKTIELLVSQKTEIEANNGELKNHNESLLQQKTSLETSVEQLGSACSELRAQVQTDGSNSEMLENLKVQTEKEIKLLKETLLEKEESYRELQSKLSKVSNENSTAQTQLVQVSSELEMCKVHLIQLRGSGAQELLNEKDNEVVALNNELGLTRQNLGEAMGRVEHLAGEREQLAEQYRNYSRDLASQAERLSEQLRKFQDENARLLHREAGLVQHVASLESQIQKFLKEGKNVTEEEICRLKDQALTYETELRMTSDEKDKLQHILTERSNQVDEMVQRLAMRDNKIMELQATVSGLGTTVEMLKSTSHTNDTDQAQFLAACQSDKVAASRAMQQNVSLKERLEELQGGLVTLTNSKAQLLDQLENANRTINSFANVEAEIAAKDEAVKEREIMLTNMKNQVKYLQEELSQRKTPDRIENMDTLENKVAEQFADFEKELNQAKEIIRSLNSQNSELTSKLEVLSSRTRDCSESRCTSSSDGRVDIVDSSLSESSDSFVEIDSGKKSSVASSDSFINVDPVQRDLKVDDYQTNETEFNSVEQTVIRTADLPFMPSQEITNSQISSSVDNFDFESVRQLENRFLAAMEQLAELSSDKEQLEHLVERLQEETETIGDYVIMYQHQRKMQKIKIQEKEEQVRQLAKDRAELLIKLSQLQELVTNMVDDDPSDKVFSAKTETLTETVDKIESSPVKVSDKMASSMEKEKILELINEIGTGSNQIMARCENFEPWFWENSPGKVVTV